MDRDRPSYHFKLIKTDTHHEPTNMMYAKWAAIILFFGISSVSFVTQGVLALKDTLVDGDTTRVTEVNINGLNHLPERQVAGVTKEMEEKEPLGSDDSKVTPFEGEAQYKISNANALPKTSARAYLAADLQTGEIIIEQNDALVAPVASVTKLMTGLVAHEKMDMQKYAIVSRDSYNTYGGQGGLLLGEKIRVQDLMYPLLMESSNDAAEVLADAFDQGHEAFMVEMNKKAAALGMVDTYYEDPSGLNPKNVSTVRDLLILGRYIHKNAPILYDMTRVKQYAIRGHTWLNRNRFLTYDSFLGGKNGYIDESKKTTVSLFDITMAKGGKRPVVIVLLKSDDREGDALKIINFLKKNAYYNVVAE
ncbi:MAG: D-alanyl-D-alanine carboxypeptidase [Candidatus Taylorbacteria bacterium]|nr:D-alanyl-D-alanine carboxypeptidase [Candidatus Taylorbacteria bacterium]